ncbi:protein BRANCHLESS TRICHOME [Populus alba]|uniref:protein BRANCHLESS TRICHOME n=1 Tax=Populus alba TaxID=43335 RepID=UPI00158E51D4|nr:protein BRANCHLESS TRICHOME [Populus alba]
MEEVKVMMVGSLHHSMNESSPQDPITTTTCTSWKLYENPFYNSQHNIQHQHQQHCQDFARAQILDLKAELEYERKARKKLETMSKRLAKELAEERRGREALERVCEELAREISCDKEEIDHMKREMEEERKMLRMAEVLREERVQMKLAEARMLFEEKLFELGGTTTQPELHHNSASRMEQKYQEDKEAEISTPFKAAAILSSKLNRLVLSENSCYDNSGADSKESTRVILSEMSSFNDKSRSISSMAIQRSRASPEPENPHIKRGIKGFVEFPRVIRAIGSKNRHWGTKLECQKAQLRILLKQKSPIRSNNLIIS